MYNLTSKEHACKKLLETLDRTIIFGNSIDSLRRITPFVITSRNSDEQNGYLRRRFEDRQIPNIASFKKLKQGANISGGLDNCVIVSYYSKEIDVIQRFGRLRKNEDILGRVFIFVTKDTREEIWYQDMLINVKDNYKVIRHKNVKDCIESIKLNSAKA